MQSHADRADPAAAADSTIQGVTNPKMGDRVLVGDGDELGGSWTEEGVILTILDRHTVKVGMLGGADLCANTREVPLDLIFQPKN